MLSSFSATKIKLFVWIALLVGLTILGYSTVYRAALGEKSRTDLTVYLRAAEAIQQNEDIYAVENERHWHYVYLPLLAILMTPFATLPLWLNALLWYLLSVAAVFGTARGLRSLFKDNEAEVFWVVLSCFILALPPLLNTFTRGQIGILGLFFGFIPFLLVRKNKSFMAGFILGFAIVLKMSPLLILPFYFLLQRNWRALAGCAVGGFVFGLILPTLVFGPELHWKYLITYFKTISGGTGDLSYQSSLWGELFTPFAGDNQSFYAVVTRLYWKTEASFIGQSNTVIRLVNFIFLLCLLSAATWKFFKAPKNSLEDKLPHDFTTFSLLSSVMLFTSPVSQLHHFTPLVLLSAAAFLQLSTNPSSKKILLSAMVLCLFFFTIGMIFDPLAILGLPLWGTLLLWLTILFSASKK